MSDAQQIMLGIYSGICAVVQVIAFMKWLENYGSGIETWFLHRWIRESRLYASVILLAPLWPLAALVILGAVIRDAFKKENR